MPNTHRKQALYPPTHRKPACWLVRWLMMIHPSVGANTHGFDTQDSQNQTEMSVGDG